MAALNEPESNPMKQKRALEELERTLYVGDLDERVTEDLLYELMIQAGPVENVKVIQSDIYFYAFVIFEDEESIPYTIQLFRKVKLFGRPLLLKPRENSNQERKFKMSSRQIGIAQIAPLQSVQFAQKIPVHAPKLDPVSKISPIPMFPFPPPGFGFGQSPFQPWIIPPQFNASGHPIRFFPSTSLPPPPMIQSPSASTPFFMAPPAQFNFASNRNVNMFQREILGQSARPSRALLPDPSIPINIGKSAPIRFQSRGNRPPLIKSTKKWYKDQNGPYIGGGFIEQGLKRMKR